MTIMGGFNTKSPTVKRILQESKEMSRNPDPSLSAAPLEENLFEWHFTFAGPPSSPYERGIYHGRIILPPSYPLRPPMFRFMTPSGRFEVNREICLSISGHHEETWQPAWGIRTALCAIRAFMESDAKGQVGGLDATEPARRRMAQESRAWKCHACGNRTMEEVMRECAERWEEAKARGTAGAEDSRRDDVPNELRLAYKDELEKNKGDGGSEEKKGEEERTGAAHSPPPGSQRITQSATASGSSSATPRRSNVPSALPTPTPTTRLAPVPQPTHQMATRPAEGVPSWVDRAIVGVTICLAFMMLKQFFV